MAGVGNIYADEALWQARIHPLRPGGELTAAEVRRLHAAVVDSLERGIASQGATISNYRGPDGQPGSMQERFNAYDRDGEPCPRCGTPIEKIRVAQRGTHLCPAVHPTALKVADRLRAAGLDVDVQELDASTRTAEEAAAAAGCELGQIVKSLVFVDASGPVLVLCAGDRRVDTALVGDDVRRATPDEVREATGFAIGGVPPLGHDAPVGRWSTSRCAASTTVWCAAGTPRAVFEVDTERLIEAIPGADVRAVTA